MNCEKYAEWISLYIDQELEEQDQLEFEKHIERCDSCREETKAIQEITKNIQTLEKLKIPEGFHKDLMDQIRQEAKKQEKVVSLPLAQRKWFINLKMASAIAAVFLFSTILIQPLLPDKTKGHAPEVAMTREDDDFGEDLAQSRMMVEPELAKEILPEETWTIIDEKPEEYAAYLIDVANDLDLEAVITQRTGPEDLQNQFVTIEILISPEKSLQLEDQIREVQKTYDEVYKEGLQTIKLIIIIAKNLI